MRQNLRLGIPMRALFVIASGLLMLPRSANADYFLENIVNNGDVNFNQELAINNAGVIAGYFGDGTVVPNNGYTVVSPFAQANFTAENFPSGSEVGFAVSEPSSLTLLAIGAILVAFGYKKQPVPVAFGGRETQFSNSRRPFLVTPPMRKSTSAFAGRWRDNSTLR